MTDKRMRRIAPAFEWIMWLLNLAAFVVAISRHHYLYATWPPIVACWVFVARLWRLTAVRERELRRW